jgi:membrane protein
MSDTRSLDEQYPGAHAGRPGEVPAKGWFQIARRGFKEFSADQMPLIAAGVAFYAFLSLVPSIVAAMLIYGLVTDPAQVQQQVESFGEVLPESARSLLSEQMSSLASANDQGLGIGVAVSLLLSLWSASGGTGNLVTAVNTAYDEDETRGFVKRKLLALGLTLGAIVVFVLTIALVAVVPAVASALSLSPVLRVAVEAGRWLLVLVVVGGALAVLYRLAPDRDAPKMRWVSVGSVVAVVVWIVASVGFSLYVDNFGSYGKTYGSLAGVVVLLLWLWLSLVAVLLGAEINAESEKQTVRDTTTGPDRPMGQRDALKADLGPADPEPSDDDRPADRTADVREREQRPAR